MRKRRTVESWHRERRFQEDRERQAIRRDWSASLLSNAKWRKLLDAISDPDLNVRQVIVKFVRGGEVLLGGPTRDEHDGWFRTMSYADPPGSGPFPYRSIEWLEIPVIGLPYKTPPIWVPYLQWEQDVQGARRALEAIGQFTFEQTERGLRIIAHVPKALPVSTTAGEA
jgi:hypothetical protein